VRLDLAPVFDPDGRARLLFATLVDVSDRVRVAEILRDTEHRFETRVEERTVALETALERTELLTREVTHRTKNALAMLGAVIEAKRRGASTEGEAELLGDISRRVRAIGRLQGLLDGLGSEVHGLDLGRFLGELVAELDAPSEGAVVFEGAPAMSLPTDGALALALCVTELVLNAQKHGVVGGRTVTIRVGGMRRGEAVVLSVSDDGAGLPQDFAPERSRGLGMLLILDQVRKLGGDLTFGASPEGGARFEIGLPC
jgi:two-component sensor histidine kinase